ncbi:DUF2642 domain-containing protein [Haloplasma contractile]|uniref:DUF2642 domain-containing protein n=1 Tax=Haloplasma contractile SSD-17B TaxID=1033810 RepID=F7PVZ8_9MOLU|nr:DUF2642 domain-containing protein [Haloplasma contractile]ERJ12678.1 hypothetical protein HLPCO_001018 [Haloplasma contractile SSD-17B]
MYQFGGQQPMGMMPNIQTVSVVEPYVYQALQSLMRQRLIVDTVRGSIEGFLVDVKPDHIVVQDRKNDQPQFIRTAQIVFIMPINNG